MITKRYKSRPVEIEAVQWDGSPERAQEICEWTGHRAKYLMPPSDANDYISIGTLEGVMRAQPLDYIVKGTAGEFYPVKPDIFELKYEEVTVQIEK